jgi:hypothetical protein
MQLTRISSVITARRRADLGSFIIRTDFIITLTLIVSTMIIGDALISWRPASVPRIYWALLDSPVHAALALLVVSPLFAHRDLHQRTFRRVVVAGLVTVFLDLDHFVAARSLSLYDALHLAARPVSHSLLFALGCGLLAHLLTRHASDGWLVFGVLASHILRGASSGGTPFLWPLGVYRLPVRAYYAAQVSLYLVTRTVAGSWFDRRAWSHGLRRLILRIPPRPAWPGGSRSPQDEPNCLFSLHLQYPSPPECADLAQPQASCLIIPVKTNLQTDGGMHSTEPPVADLVANLPVVLGSFRRPGQGRLSSRHAVSDAGRASLATGGAAYNRRMLLSDQ